MEAVIFKGAIWGRHHPHRPRVLCGWVGERNPRPRYTLHNHPGGHGRFGRRDRARAGGSTDHHPIVQKATPARVQSHRHVSCRTSRRLAWRCHAG